MNEGNSVTGSNQELNQSTEEALKKIGGSVEKIVILTKEESYGGKLHELTLKALEESNQFIKNIEDIKKILNSARAYIKSKRKLYGSEVTIEWEKIIQSIRTDIINIGKPFNIDLLKILEDINIQKLLERGESNANIIAKIEEEWKEQGERTNERKKNEAI